MVEIGGVYIVHTAMTRPPKDKIVLCIAVTPELFFWFNTAARHHGHGQLPVSPAEHPEVLTRDCHLDLSRVTTFSPLELSARRPQGVIRADLARRIVAMLQAGVKTLPKRQGEIAAANLAARFQNGPEG